MQIRYIYISFWSYKSTERAYELGHHLAGCDPKNVLDHPGSFTKSEWQGQTKEVLRCFQLAMQQCFWVLDIFCRPAAWMRLMMRLDPNVVGSCWIYRSCLHDLCWNSSPRPWYFQGGGTIVWNIYFFFNGDRSSSGNLQGVCFRANTVGKPLSTDSRSASDSTIFPMRSNTLNCQWF